MALPHGIEVDASARRRLVTTDDVAPRCRLVPTDLVAPGLVASDYVAACMLLAHVDPFCCCDRWSRGHCVDLVLELGLPGLEIRARGIELSLVLDASTRRAE